MAFTPAYTRVDGRRTNGSGSTPPDPTRYRLSASILSSAAPHGYRVHGDLLTGRPASTRLQCQASGATTPGTTATATARRGQWPHAHRDARSDRPQPSP